MRTVFGSSIAPKARAFFNIVCSVALLAAFQVASIDDAEAKKRKRSKGNPKYAAFVIDAKTGKVLHSRNGNSRRYPASLTKMMTLYLMFEDLKSGRIRESDRVVMTKAGSRRPPSKLGLRPGQSLSVKQAMYSLVTKSANDVATAVGDKLAGSEAKFARRMTRKARQLGMRRTTFRNASGLTARGQTTTASDMAKLGLALREHFPRRYKMFKTRSFRFGRRNYGNHNKLLGRVRGVDGIKTGYTRASGFNLVSSVSSGGRKIVAVVMGGRSGARRNAQMARLIARYLPKASRGGQRRLITKARSSYSRSVSVKVASAAKRTTTQPSVKQIKQVKKQIVALAKKTRPTPVLRSSINPEKIDNVVTASVASKKTVKQAGGKWQIQLGASENRTKLMQVLKTAKSKNKKLLSGNQPVTVKVNRGNTALYRARFTGFASYKSAARVCKVLKRQKYACLALNG